MSTRESRIGEVILEMSNISLSFGGVKALTDISFDVREHEIRAIIGPNGAGKSSMLNVINGVYVPQRGGIRFAGKQFDRMTPRRAAEMGAGDPVEGPRLGRFLLAFRKGGAQPIRADRPVAVVAVAHHVHGPVVVVDQADAFPVVVELTDEGTESPRAGQGGAQRHGTDRRQGQTKQN